MVQQKPVGTTRLENAEIFRKVRKTTFSRSPPGQSLCQWRQKGVSRPNSGGVAADFHDAQLENQTSDRLRIGGNLLVTNSSIDCERFISGLSSPLSQHLLVSFEELLSLRLSDRFALVVGCINSNWLNLWKKDACKVFTGILPPL